MEEIKASCGCLVPAVGKPGSIVRQAVTQRTCKKPRCRSGLPKKFTDEECEAWCWLWDCGIKGWSVDYADKTVRDHSGSHDGDWLSLVEFAKAMGRRK